jgi:hypothetical protein
MREVIAAGAFEQFRARVRAEWERGDLAPL